MTRAKAETGTTTQVSARVSKEVADTLQAMADQNERSLSWVVSFVLRDWIEQKNATAAKTGK